MSIDNINRILVLAPHTDDGEFGCGGSVTRFIDEGKEVFYVAFSTAAESVPEPWPKDILKTEVKEAAKRLSIPQANLTIFNFKVRELSYHRQEVLEELVKIKNEVCPDLVFLPSSNDLHQDHSTVSIVARGTLKNTIIHSHVKIDNLVHIAHNCIIGENSMIIACAEVSGSTVVGKNCWLGVGCSTMQKITLGDNCLIGIGAVVLKDVPSGAVMAENPAKVIRMQV